MSHAPLDARPAGSPGSLAGASPARSSSLPALGVMLLSAWAGMAEAAVQANARPGAGAGPGFNFSYQPEGSRSAAPTQVFDDGRRTYLQFNALDRVPELWTDDAGSRVGARRIAFHLESPYVIVDQVLPRIRLVVEGEDTILVNQGWHQQRTPIRAPAKIAAPRIWTDTTPFGPGDPPGPVASAREARPSRELRKRPGVPTPPGKAGTPSSSSAAVLAVSDDPEDSSALEGAPPASPADIEQAEQSLEQRPILLSEHFEITRLEQMRAEALAMIERARREGNSPLEEELRRIFNEIALAGAAPASNELRAGRSDRRKPGPDPVPARGPMLALADTRLRPDVTPREEVDASDARALVPGTSVANPVPAPAGGNAVGESAPALPAGGAGPAAQAVPLSFEVRDNQRLSQALAQFLETLGWRLEWESQSDFVVRRGYVVRAATLKQVLLETLGEYHLSAVLYSGNLVVAVSGGQR